MLSRRTRAILLTLPLALDCLANKAHGGSICHTLSGEAARNRSHKWWGWTAEAIDVFFAIFGDVDHCNKAAEKEKKWGSIWAAWAADIKG